MMQRRQNLDENANLVLERQVLALQHLRQVFALQVLHRDVDHAVDLAGLVDGDDVRVREAGAGLGLAHQTFEVVGPVNVGPDGLDRHDALQGGVEGLVDLAHPAATEQRLYLEAPDRFRQR